MIMLNSMGVSESPCRIPDPIVISSVTASSTLILVVVSWYKCCIRLMSYLATLFSFSVVNTSLSCTLSNALIRSTKHWGVIFYRFVDDLSNNEYCIRSLSIICKFLLFVIFQFHVEFVEGDFCNEFQKGTEHSYSSVILKSFFVTFFVY